MSNTDIAATTTALATPPEPAITYTLPNATIGNLDMVEKYVSDVEEFFAGTEINPADQTQAKDLKRINAHVNKVAKAINDKRIAMDKEIKGAISNADDALNSLRDRLKAVYANNAAQIAKADELWLNMRITALETEYASTAPDLMQLVPLNAFLEQERKLTGKSWCEAKACEALDKMIIATVESRKRLASMQLKYATEADAVFCKTLSLESALDENTRLQNAARAAAAHKAEIKAMQERMNARKAAQEQPATQVTPVMPAKVYKYAFTFTGTAQDAAAVKDFLHAQNLTNATFERVNNND